MAAKMIRSLITAALVLASPLAAQTVAQPKLPEWMAGTWMMQDGAEWFDEMWTDPRCGIMLGLGRNGFGSELNGWELMQIRQGSDGRIKLIARPDGKPPVEFPLVLISEEAIEFANPAHDYPQRIRYWRQGKLLMAEISLLDGSRSLRWNYRPVIPPQDE